MMMKMCTVASAVPPEALPSFAALKNGDFLPSGDELGVQSDQK